ncbi:fumarylacetoacetate hydrolase family protein [uncultured Parasphingorhabdus sp.]|uniref:fumarylacetoacetate hydrolase family protein n=1 Tax=uncultured Parasphingorhabdus sp. TaxID=2709694 RepID=UPI0030D8B620|tara:strand:- start:21048 stop:22016 length:969 start_codon:yes stop_codon:yes gene_type:complete
MILATLKTANPDGQLIAVSGDHKRYVNIEGPVSSLLGATENWDSSNAKLQDASGQLEQGGGDPLDVSQLAAPMPRSWQWLDGSAFSTHGELMQIAFGLDPIDTDRPLMYQGVSDRFFGPTEDVPLPSMEHGIDFEGEFGVIVDHVPMGTSAEDAMQHIKLIVQINDWSLRAIAPVEMKTGFGWVQAKPACSMAPFAVTPDELGEGWKDGRVCLDLEIDLNGKKFGSANGAVMDFGFHELVAHAALTRDLVPGTIIGSGTVSNPNYAEVGSSCISEVRAIEMIRDKAPATTSFMAFGDSVRMEGRGVDGSSPFGVIDQKVVQA